MWTDDWVGLDYRAIGRGPDEYDCLGLFLAIQKARHGRELHDPLCTMSEAARNNIAEANKALWRPVRCAREGDAVLFRVRGFAFHVGYALGPKTMLHVEDNAASVIADFSTSNWGDRLEGIYTYVG